MLRSLTARLQLKARFSRFTQSQRVQTVPGLQLSQPPLYERKPVWWYRAGTTWFIIAINSITAFATVELEMHHWTKQVPQEDKTKPPEYVPRPLYQRLGYAMSAVVLSIGVSVMLFWSRSRSVRRLYLLPPHPPMPSKQVARGDTRRVFIQTITHWNSWGKLYMAEDCNLLLSKSGSELLLQVPMMRGAFSMEKGRVKVNGKPVTDTAALNLVQGVWSTGKEQAIGNWINGPVLKNKNGP